MSLQESESRMRISSKTEPVAACGTLQVLGGGLGLVGLDRFARIPEGVVRLARCFRFLFAGPSSAAHVRLAARSMTCSITKCLRRKAASTRQTESAKRPNNSSRCAVSLGSELGDQRPRALRALLIASRRTVPRAMPARHPELPPQRPSAEPKPRRPRSA